MSCAKFFVLAICISTPQATNIRNAENPVKIDDIEAGNCPDGYTGLIPHPTFCPFYYLCANGTPYLGECPSGGYFNPREKACDIPSNVPECVGGTRPPSTTVPTTTVQTTTVPTTAVPTTTVPTTTTPQTTSTTTIEPPETEGTVNTGPTITTIGPTSAPPATTNAPETEGTVNTGQTNTATSQTITTTPTTTTTPSTTTPPADLTCPNGPPIFMAYPGNCYRYYLCENGSVVSIHDCHSGLWFRFSNQSCMTPWGGNCNQN